MRLTYKVTLRLCGYATMEDAMAMDSDMAKYSCLPKEKGSFGQRSVLMPLFRLAAHIEISLRQSWPGDNLGHGLWPVPVYNIYNSSTRGRLQATLWGVL